MVDIALHTGITHPSLLWILVPSLLTFIAGLGIGASSGCLRAWLRASDQSTTE